MLKCFYLCILICSMELVVAQTPLNYTQQLTASDGLSYNDVTFTFEDSKKYLWVGTFYGLNRYDGYDFTVYKNSSKNTSLISNNIRCITEDSKGRIWIGTDMGISVYKYSSDTFTTVLSSSDDFAPTKGLFVSKLIEEPKSKNMYCFTEQNGIIVFDSAFQFVREYHFPDKAFYKEVSINDAIILDESNFLLSAMKGLVHFNKNTQKFVRIIDPQIQYSNSILGFDKNKILVTPHLGFAILSYKIEHNTFSYTLLSKDLQSYRFISATIDNLNNLWFGTFNNGLIRVNNLNKVLAAKPTTISKFELENELCKVRHILPTQTNTCWVSTRENGVYKFDSEDKPFHYVDDHFKTNPGVYPNKIITFSVLDSQRVFVNPNSKELELLNTTTKKNEEKYADFSSFSSAKLSNIFIDSKKNTWIRYANNTIIKLENNNKKFDIIQHENLQKQFNFREFVEDFYGNIWIHCRDYVYKLSLDGKGKLANCEVLKMHPFFIDNNFPKVSKIYPDPLLPYIWLGSNQNGLYRIKLEKEKALNSLPIEQFYTCENDKSTLIDNFVTTIKRAPNKDLWVGTQGGLCKAIEGERTLQFKRYTEQDGLTSNIIKNILIDKNSCLWIPTNFGLNYLDPSQQSIRKFYKEQGLPFDEFRPGSAILDNDIVLLSSDYGYFYFNTNIGKKVAKEHPILHFGKLKVFGTTISPGDTVDNRVLLQKNLNNTQNLQLNHNENSFSIELISPHYSNPNSYYLKYRLHPINTEWVKVTSNNKYIQFNALQTGKYVFEAMASNSNGEWTDVREIEITINPPWWNTLIMRMVYIILAIVFIYGIIKYRMKILRLQHSMQLKQIEKERVDEINKAKLQYFSNISHEIKTPITLIAGPAELLLNEYSNQPKLLKNLRIIQQQSQKVVQLINQVHEFQQSDAVHPKLNNSHFCLNIFLDEIIANFEFMANMHEKHLLLLHQDDTIFVYADKDKLERVFNNLLNNAFKYTQPNDRIEISYRIDDVKLCIDIKDTGIGITEEDIPHIFERFYRSKARNTINVEGAGIGLAFSKRLIEMHNGEVTVESVPNVETIFTVVLPIVTKSVSEEIYQEEKATLKVERSTPTENITINANEKKLSVNVAIQKASVYLVEDNVELRDFISNSLKDTFEVTAFNNGQLCIDALENEWPDLIVSDVLMPEINGFELCRKIKSDIKTSHIPVILLTACAELPDKVQGLREGADSYITKPFDIQYLVSNIESILVTRKQLRERFNVNIPLTLKAEEFSGADVAFIEKLYDLMEKNLSNPEIDMDYFARHLYLNRSYFFKKVKALTNQTPYDVLKAYRVKKAAEFLTTENMSIADAFVSAGFKNRPHFNRVFKEHLKMTPSQYVEDFKNKKT